MLVVNVVAEVSRIRGVPRILWMCCLCCTWTPVVNFRLPTCHRLVKSHEEQGKVWYLCLSVDD